MPRIKLVIPEILPFVTELDIRVADINYGGHLGNDAVLALLHEARLRFLGARGWSETDIAGAGLIMTDAVVVYRSEAFHGERVRIGVGVDDCQKCGCDIVYRMTASPDGREIARAKTGMAFFNYATRKVVPIPPAFKAAFERCASAEGA